MVAVGLPLNVSSSLEFRELNFGVVIVVHLGLENYPANYFPLFSKICLVCTFFSSFEEFNCWFLCCVDEKVFLWPVAACFSSWVFFIALLSGFLRLFLLSLFSLPSFTYHCNDLFLGCIVLYLHPLVMASSEGVLLYLHSLAIDNYDTRPPFTLCCMRNAKTCK